MKKCETQTIALLYRSMNARLERMICSRGARSQAVDGAKRAALALLRATETIVRGVASTMVFGAFPDEVRILSGVRSRFDQRFVRRKAWIAASVGWPSR
ncbi:hypothetical protein [Burkholderia diffusa]|uniref:hypothetical protein n=1 Tax=Burkholderia TaxID=32008 RepID=UPI001245BBB4|nr:hypothetical protein [Burkholderia diffusa]KAB0657004.1 hypothetical protein F7R23_12750 [Burkholderia diffusa]MBM2656134.1 hypothetical protein [Burkholderia diffusa]